MTRKLLITGFDPFGKDKINPSWEAVKRLPDAIGDCELVKLQLPVIFGEAAETVLRKAAEVCPEAILCVGQAGGRKAVTPEVVGINLREASLPDNAGKTPQNQPVIASGPAAYFSTLPVREIVEAVKKEGIACALSYSAGAYVCNDLLYTLLHHYDETTTRVGFIHVPYLPEQTDDQTASMPLETMVRALSIAVEVVSGETDEFLLSLRNQL